MALAPGARRWWQRGFVCRHCILWMRRVKASLVEGVFLFIRGGIRRGMAGGFSVWGG